MPCTTHFPLTTNRCQSLSSRLIHILTISPPPSVVISGTRSKTLSKQTAVFARLILWLNAKHQQVTGDSSSHSPIPNLHLSQPKYSVRVDASAYLLCERNRYQNSSDLFADLHRILARHLLSKQSLICTCCSLCIKLRVLQNVFCSHSCIFFLSLLPLIPAMHTTTLLHSHAIENKHQNTEQPKGRNARLYENTETRRGRRLYREVSTTTHT